MIGMMAHEYFLSKYENQHINYLKITNIKVGILLNFEEAELKRKIFDNILMCGTQVRQQQINDLTMWGGLD